jgi:hypothetical protein
MVNSKGNSIAWFQDLSDHSREPANRRVIKAAGARVTR